ncbi:MAG: PilZ domain-containing protein [Ruminiclostridium sp.]|nr:PilZ domain-containing protein [Ruminiclostridium sp.]
MGIPTRISEIAVQVHSIDYVLKCYIISMSGNKINISPREKKVDMFQVNDPVVLMYMDEGLLKLLSGDITMVDISGNIVQILITDIDVEEERRIFERYPVSLAVSARRKFSSKRLHLIAKNINEYGMSAVSRVELDKDESVDMDLITGKYMFYFVGKVIWKEKQGDRFLYSFQLTNFDVATKSFMEVYLGKLKEEYMIQYIKAK